MIEIYPSLLAANPLGIGHAVKQLEPHCAGFHIDLMDNHFVPNLWGSVGMVNGLIGQTRKAIWIHLMVENPLSLIKQLHVRKHDIISFHIESIEDSESVERILSEIKCRSSIAISPQIELETIFPLLRNVGQALLMSVNPGFAGQAFLEESYKRLQELVAYKMAHGLRLHIGIDGGITTDNIAKVCDLGAQDIVVGNAIFDSPDIIERMKQLNSMLQNRLDKTAQ